MREITWQRAMSDDGGNPAMAGGSGSAPLSGRFCPKPFDNLSIDADGGAWVCCADWLPTPIGNVRGGSVAAAWNSPTAQAIRASILDGSFRFCDASACPAIVQDTLPRREDVARHRYEIATGETRLSHGPRSIGMGYDNTCNLKCPSCRSEIFALRGEPLREAQRIHSEVVGLLPDAEFLLITGTGDALASPLYRRFLRTFDAARWPHVRIGLMTNGLLFTPRMWESLAAAQPAIRGVSISVDAATAATYGVNRGGSFPRLLANLGFAGELTAAGRLEWFELSFVVQRNNFREMEPFIELGFARGATGILFQRMMHWAGTCSRESYLDAAVHLPDHPDHQAFLGVLQAGAFADPRVDLSNLADLRGSARDAGSRGS